MARYIDADALIRLIEIDAVCNGGNFSKREVIGSIKVSPTFDVVPKSEVEALLKENERWMIEYAGFRAGVKSSIKNAEQKVAQEIFAKMENIINRYCKDYKYTIADVLLDITELRKKYTEGAE